MITPESLAKANTEHSHQMALFLWMRLQQDKWPELKLAFAIANGGKRDQITAAKLKAEGVKPGVSDIFIPIARGPFHGFFLEMKKPGGKESPEQIAFGAAVQDQGYFYACAESWSEASAVITWYMEQS